MEKEADARQYARLTRQEKRLLVRLNRDGYGDDRLLRKLARLTQRRAVYGRRLNIGLRDPSVIR